MLQMFVTSALRGGGGVTFCCHCFHQNQPGASSHAAERGGVTKKRNGKTGDPPDQMGETEEEQQASVLFETFVQASTCKGTLQAFAILCRQLDLDPLDHSSFYGALKAAVSTWKVKTLWTKLDKRAQQKVYNHNKACQGTRVRLEPGFSTLQRLRFPV